LAGVLLVVAASSLPARAEPPVDEAAMKLATLVGDSKVSRDLTGTLRQSLANAVMRSNPALPAAAKPVVDAEVDASLADMTRRRTEFLAKRFAAKLAPGDIKAAVEFFSSPAGRKFSDMTNDMLADMAMFSNAESMRMTAALATNLKEKLVAAGHMDRNAPLNLGPNPPAR
jgi:hypothetical protein